METHAFLATGIAVLWVAGCGTSTSGNPEFAPEDAGSGSQAPGDGGDDVSPVLVFSDSGSSGLVLTGSDAASQTVTFPCQPGTYAGPFTTTVTTDAGLFPSLLSFNWSGSLSITLVGHVMAVASSNGEDFAPAPVLTIAPGAMLSGTDNFGGNFVSGLSGQLDCPSRTLTGTLSNGVYIYPGDSGSITLDGTLTGVYQATPAPPSLTMGTIVVTSPMYSTLGATGTWSAVHQ